jgi:hypothetical protein
VATHELHDECEIAEIELTDGGRDERCDGEPIEGEPHGAAASSASERGESIRISSEEIKSRNGCSTSSGREVRESAMA